MRRWFRGLFDNIAVTSPGAPPQRRDWAIAAVLAAAILAELFLVDSKWPVARLVPGLIAVGLVPFRRQIPLQAAVAAFSVQFVFEIVALSVADVENWTAVGHLIAGLMLIYAMCRWLPPPRVAVGLALTMAMASAGEAADGDTLGVDVLLVAPWLGLALFALAMRYRARLIEQRGTEIRLTERNALARELHDTVAHHVSAIAVQAQAAQYIADSDPDEAKKVMANVEEIANSTIDEMRRMVGILRSDADHARTVAATSLIGLADPDAIPKVTLTGETTLEHLPTTIAAAMYRISQEAISNARSHSRNVTFIDVKLATRHEAVEVEIINDGTPTTSNRGGGFGLIGMNERVEALRGTITSGQRPASGWRVHATIPLAHPGGA